MEGFEQYRWAQADELYRGEFCASLDLEEMKPFVRAVAYEPQQDFWGRHNLMMNVPSLWSSYGAQGFPSRVLVSPRAFRLGYPDFVSSLVDHEGFHAQEVFNYSRGKLMGLYFVSEMLGRISSSSERLLEHTDEWSDGLFSGYQVLDANNELRALHNQLRKGAARGMSSQFCVSLLELFFERHTYRSEKQEELQTKHPWIWDLVKKEVVSTDRFLNQALRQSSS